MRKDTIQPIFLSFVCVFVYKNKIKKGSNMVEYIFDIFDINIRSNFT